MDRQTCLSWYAESGTWIVRSRQPARSFVALLAGVIADDYGTRTHGSVLKLIQLILPPGRPSGVLVRWCV